MKSTIKKLLLASWLALLVCCDAPEISVRHTGVRDIHLQILNNSTLQKHPRIVQKLSSFGTISAHERVIRSDVYHFDIETDYCKYLIVDDVESFTFKVTYGDTTKFTNLVLTKHFNDSISSLLYHYDVTPSEKERLLSGEQVNLTDKIRVDRMTDSVLMQEFNLKTNIKSLGICWDMTPISVPHPCASGNHQPGDASCLYLTNPPYASFTAWTSTATVLTPSNCGGSGNPNPGGTSPNPFDPVNGSGSTTPNGGPPKILPRTSCEMLRDASDHPDICSVIGEIRNNFSLLHETARKVGTQPNGTVVIGPQIASSESSATVGFNLRQFGVIHSHPFGKYPMFLLEDLVFPYQARNYILPAGDVNFTYDDIPFNMMVVASSHPEDVQDSPDGYVYAAVFPNKNNYGAHVDDLDNLHKVQSMDRVLKEDYEREGLWAEVPQKRLAKLFLQSAMNRYNISLYRRKLGPDHLPTGKWEKLTINNSIPGGIKLTPCD